MLRVRLSDGITETDVPEAVLCEVIGEPIKRLAQLIGEPIKLTGKRALRKALAGGHPPQATHALYVLLCLSTCSCSQFAAVLNEKKRKCLEWKREAERAQEAARKVGFGV